MLPQRISFITGNSSQKPLILLVTDNDLLLVLFKEYYGWKILEIHQFVITLIQITNLPRVPKDLSLLFSKSFSDNLEDYYNFCH